MTNDISDRNWHGIPRNEIEWYPKIDKEKCTNCMTCVKFCHSGVYEATDGKAIVTKPYNCIVGCAGCDSICPNGAISHPPKEYLVELENRYSKQG